MIHSINDPDITDPGDWLYYDHIYTNDMPETREILHQFYDLVKDYNSQVIFFLDHQSLDMSIADKTHFSFEL